MDKFPGQVEAEALGYELHNYTPSGKRATYVKSVESDYGKPTRVILWLTVEALGEFPTVHRAELISSYKGIKITSEWFQWPHINFIIFESQILHIAEGAILTEGK